MAGQQPSQQTDVTICIPMRGWPARLERLLSSLLGQRDAPAFDVLVVVRCGRVWRIKPRADIVSLRRPIGRGRTAMT